MRMGIGTKLRHMLALLLCICFVSAYIPGMAETEPMPEPTGETTPEPTGETTPEPTGETTPEPTGETTPEPTGETTPEPTGETTPEPTGETTPEPTGETTPEPTGETTPEPTGETTPEPTGETTPEPTGETTPEPTAETTPDPTGETTPEPTPDSTPEPTAEPTPTPEPTYTISLSADTSAITSGRQFAVSASGLPDGMKYNIRIIAEDGSTVTSGERDAAMKFTLYKSGNYTLEVTGGGGSAELAFYVAPVAPTSIWFDAKNLGLDESYAIEIHTEPWYAETTYTYKTSAKKYVTVDEAGIITGVKRGSANITVTSANGLTYTAKVTVKKKPTSVKLTASDTSLGVGENAQITWKLSSGSASRPNVQIVNASAENVISVTNDGKVTALNPGKATVRATTYNGLYAEVEFVVAPAPEQIRLPESLKVSVNDSIGIGASVTQGSETTITYTSSDSSVATVSADGKVKGVKTGVAVITARTHNGLEAECTVNVMPAPTKITLNYTTITVGVGEKFTLAGTLEPDGAVSTLSFQSKNTKYATVDENGVVTAKKAGTVYIYAYTYNNKSARCKVIIRSAPSSVKLNRRSVILGYDVSAGKGETCKLTATIPSKTASHGMRFFIEAQQPAGVASVDRNGNITAKGLGWADVTVITHNGKSATCRVTVLPATGSLTISPLSRTVIGVGQSVNIDVSKDPGTAGNVTLSASPSGIVSIESDGRIKGLKKGTVTITATTFNGLSASAQMQVVDAPGKVTVQKSKATIGVGDTFAIVASIPEGTMTDLTYSSSKTSVATVDASGVVTAHKTGTAKITVKTHNGKKATVTITVRKAPTSVSFDKSELRLHTGDTARPGVTITKSSSTSYTFTSSNTAVATVAADGTITARGLGTAVITVKTHNGLTADITVRVIEPPYSIVVNNGMAVVTAVGVTSELPVIVYTESGDVYEGTVTYKSSNSSVLKISGGMMQGKKRGSVSVTVTAGSVETKFTVEVKRYSDLVDPAIIAHRGNGGGYPENSLEGILTAMENGATWVEIDVRRTKDGVLVLCHDATVDRMSNGTGKVSDMTYAELLQLDFSGTRICTLEQAAAAIRDSDLSFMVEFKDEGIAEDAIAIIHKYGIQDRTLYGSFKLGELQTVLRIDPDALTAFIYGSGSYYTDTAIEIALENGIDALFPKYSAISESIAAKIHASGLLLGTYTVNTKSQYDRVIAAGVDFISTDDPSYIYDLLN